jgi:ABC-type hemin transport system substrate-binding protein
MLKDHPEAQELIDKLDKLGKDMHAEYVKKEAELKLKYSIKELEDQIKAKEEELKILLDASKKEVIEGDDKVPEQIFKELKDNYLDSS